MRELIDTTATLRIVTERDDRVLAERSIEGPEYRFERMPPEIVNAFVQIDSWKVRHRIDLTAGGDTDTTLEIDAIEVSGEVTYGGEPSAARVQFRHHDESADTHTDDAGRYRAVLWQTGRFVTEVWLREQPSVPSFQDTFWLDANTSTLDFKVPRTSYQVRVVDHVSGKPIGRASVGFLNRWNDPHVGRRSHGRAVFTDDRGVAALPPLRAGEVEVRASAAGYGNSEPVRFLVPAGDPVQDPPAIEVRLHPAGKAAQVRLVLANGSAAAGARLALVSDSFPSLELFRAVADLDGAVAIPDGFEGSILLVRHPAAGALVRRWSGTQSEPWVLPPPGDPLLVRVRHADERPARSAAIVMWVNGCSLNEAALMFLTDQPPLTDQDGIWTVRNLPRESFHIAALKRSREIAGNTLAPLASAIHAPWPATVSLRVIE